MDCNSRQDDLIYDIGAHKGDDAAFYLAKGFRVISVEAHPTHASVIRRRFSSEIEDGRPVLEVGSQVSHRDEQASEMKKGLIHQ